MLYADLIDQLLEFQSDPKGDEYFFSGYFNSEGLNRDALRQELKSKILTHLHRHDEVGEYSTIHNHVVTLVEDWVRDREDLPVGLGVFGMFNVEDDDKDLAFDDMRERFVVVPLASVPEEQMYVGRTFLLDQLIAMESVGQGVLVMSLDQQRCVISVLGRDSVRVLFVIENEEVVFEDRMYVERMGGSVKGRYFGTGSQKPERVHEKFNKRFVKNVGEFLENEVGRLQQFGYLVVFYSKTMESVVDDLLQRDSIGKAFSVLSCQELLMPGDDRLVPEAHRIVEEHDRQEHVTQLEEAKEEFATFSTGWHDVSEAASQAKVDTLFVKSGVEQHGYIYADGLVSSYPVEGSQRIENLTPWLVRSVAMQGGDVVMFESDELGEDVDVAAKLRY